jgi:hypothetical protein
LSEPFLKATTSKLDELVLAYITTEQYKFVCSSDVDAAFTSTTVC